MDTKALSMWSIWSKIPSIIHTEEFQRTSVGECIFLGSFEENIDLWESAAISVHLGIEVLNWL